MNTRFTKNKSAWSIAALLVMIANTAIAAFPHGSINTGILTPGLLGGIIINGQITYPSVYIYPTRNQELFTTIRTCFNPQSPFSGMNLYAPIESLSSGLILNLRDITSALMPVQTGLTNLLAGVFTPVALSTIEVNFAIYSDAGGDPIKTLTGVSIPAFGCVTYSSNFNSDPLLGSLIGTRPGLYSVIVDAPALQDLSTLSLGFIYGSADSSGNDALFRRLMQTN